MGSIVTPGHHAVSWLFIAVFASPEMMAAQTPDGRKAESRDGQSDLAAALRAPRALPARIRFDHLTTAQGLSNDSVFTILQDRHGFMWFGTQAGLNRYDGYRVTQYRHDPNNPNSLASDFVNIMFEDSRGGIWTSANDALSLFDPETETFSRFPLPIGASASGTRLTVQAIGEDLAGGIWLGVSGGRSAYRLDPRTKRVTAVDIGGPLAGGQDNPVTSIYRDPSGMIWLGAASGLIRLDPASGLATRYTNHGSSRRALGIRRISQDRAGNLWLAADANGPNFFDPAKGVYARRWGARPRERAGQEATSILARDGIVWLGSSERLELYDEDRGSFGFLRHNPADRFSIGANEILSIAQDRDGGIWVGTKGAGVDLFSPDSLRFGPWRPNPDDDQSLTDENIRAIYRDREGAIWLGTYDGGLNRFDPSSGGFTHFRHDPRNPASLDDDRVYSIYEDRAGQLWVGTSRGINRLDRKTGRFTRFSRGALDAVTWAGPTYSLLEDRQGRFWFGGTEHRAALDRRTGAVTSVATAGGLSMFEDREGNLWFASNVGGLSRMDTSGRIRKIRLAGDGGRNTASSPQVNYMHEDSQGVMWLATETGLLRLDPRTEAVKSYTAADGLPDNVVQCILADQAGDLWISTNSGISRFRPAGASFTNYHEADGLQGEQFNRKACFADSNGTMYFGGVHGFNMFDPRRVPPPREAGQVVMTELRIGGKTVPVRAGSALPRPVWEIDRLNLGPDDKEFSLEFAALNYRDQTRTRYRFRLENLEKSWTQVDSLHRYARYTGIAPGDYRFRVQASVDGRTWGPGEASLAVYIAPPWWMTTWARLGAIAIFASILFGAYRLRVAALHRRERLLRALVDQRTAELVDARDQAEQAKDEALRANRAKSAFLANMSHELRTPLNSIIGFSDLLRRTDVSEPQRRDLEVINRSGEHLLTLIDDVLDVAKIEAGRETLHIGVCALHRLVADVVEMMRARAGQKHVTLALEEAAGVPGYVRADAPKLRQILINLLGNAVKFTDEGSITLRLAAAEGDAPERVKLRFEVEDTGIGIAPEDQRRIFEAFEQVPSASGSKGTGLGLAIAARFVELMGGSIELESTPGKGSRFRVEIPFERADESTEPAANMMRRVVGLVPGQSAWRIEVVDDDDNSRAVLERTLRDMGLDVRTAENGAAGVELFRQWRPHFVFMDLGMPVMDGIEATRRIRALREGATTPIAAVTASVFASERDRVLGSGMQAFIRKPYRTDEIFDCLAKHLGVAFQYAQSSTMAGADAADTECGTALSTLPAELRRELARAVVSLDESEIAAAIEKIERVDAAVGQMLRRMNEALNYTEMFRMAALPSPSAHSEKA